MGIFFVIAAFVGVVAIFYLMINDQQKKADEIAALEEEADVMTSERDVAKRKASELEEKVGTSFELKKLVKAAKQEYDYAERSRKDGVLWVDRADGTLVVTLGAIHGLLPGEQLSVYDADKQFGFVVVETALDTVAYVRPLYKRPDEFFKDHYRVVIEQ
jgi:hypothetical protein